MEGREKSPEDVEKTEDFRHSITSNLLEDILQCSQGAVQRVVVTSATYPYHVEWTNSDWSKACGWQSDEILGKEILPTSEQNRFSDHHKTRIIRNMGAT